MPTTFPRPLIIATGGDVPGVGPTQLFSSVSIGGIDPATNVGGITLHISEQFGVAGDTIQLQLNSNGFSSQPGEGGIFILYNGALVAFESTPDDVTYQPGQPSALDVTFATGATPDIVARLIQQLTVTASATSAPVPQGERDFAITLTTPDNQVLPYGYVLGTNGDDSFTLPSGYDALFNGGAGFDTVNVGGSTAVTLSLAEVGPQAVGSHYIELNSIEGLVGSSANDILTGDDRANYLNGGQGDDMLSGGRGADVLDGGESGVDRLDGGLGDDILIGHFRAGTYIGGGNVDLLTFGNLTVATSAIVATDPSLTIDLNVGAAQSQGSFAITVSGVENLTAGSGNDTISGTFGVNILSGGDGNDSLFGRGGDDVLFGGAGDDVLGGGAGNDTMVGGAGSDTYYVDSAGDVVSDQGLSSDVDTVITSVNYSLPADVEVLKVLSTVTNGLALGGSVAANTIVGGSGGDMITGGGGGDRLTGGAGNDIFAYLAASDSFVGAGNDTGTRDRITDFTQGEDHLSLQFGQPLTFIGENGFDGGAGEIRIKFTGNATLVDVDLNGDKVSDFEVSLAGHHVLTAADFGMAAPVVAADTLL